MYVTWGVPGDVNPVETYLLVACKAANGMGGVLGTDDQKVFDAIWARIQKGTKGDPIRRASDNVVLSYYGFFDKDGDGKMGWKRQRYRSQ